MLRFDHIRAHEVGPFRDLDVDLSALPSVVAITGPNGAGKSTFLELLHAAAYREGPTRGALAGLARGRDSWVEVDVVNGAPWRIRQTVDAVSGKGESLVLDAAGEPVTASTKLREVDAWIASHLPSREVLASTTFGAQGSAGFLALKPAERKAVLLRVLGIERLERMAGEARERARVARAELDVVVARQREIVGPSAVEVHETRDRAADAEQAAQAAVEEARRALDDARSRQAAIDEQLRARRERAEAFERLARRADGLRSAISRDEDRITNNRGLINRRAEIEAAVARVAELRTAIAEAEVSLRHADSERARLDADATKALTADDAALQLQMNGCNARERAAAPVAARRSEVDHAIAQLDDLRRSAADADADLRIAEAALDELLGRHVSGAEERIASLREGFADVVRVAEIDAAHDTARRAIDADDDAARFAADAPALQRDARARVASARTNATASADRLRAAERLASQRIDVEVAEGALVQLAAEREHLEKARRELVARAATLREEAFAARTTADRLRQEINRHHAEIDSALRTAALADRLAASAARIEELEAAIARARAELAEVDAETAEIGTDDAESIEPVDVARYESDLRARETALRSASGALAVAERELVAAEARDARRIELDAERERISSDLSDWTRLAADLGKDGIQALEIDAAGPELSALTNDLLHTCVGPRWTVTIDTQRLGSDGRLLESLEVRVLDTEGGREAPVETFSGGERVLIGEAVSLALAMLACRRSGQHDVTIVRDESGAALDAEKGRAYVAMLRRALQLTGARQVLLVSHSEEVASLCDARLHVEGGKVEVRA